MPNVCGFMKPPQGASLLNIRLAIAALVVAAASLKVSASEPIDPVSPTRNVRTECGGGATQATCDAFMADYLAYQAVLQSRKEEASAIRKVRYEQIESEGRLVTLPRLIRPAKFGFSSELQRRLSQARPRVEGLVQEWQVRFFVDSSGRPYHSSVWAYRYSLGLETYELHEIANDSVQACKPLADVQYLARTSNDCLALEGVAFTPALTADGTAMAADVIGKFMMASGGLGFEVVSAKPILFPTPNEPTRAWHDFQVKRAADQERQALMRQDQEVRRQEQQAEQARRFAEEGQVHADREQLRQRQACTDARSKLDQVVAARALRAADLEALRRDTEAVCAGVNASRR